MATDDLTSDDIAAIRAMIVRAFTARPDGTFSDDDWAHAVGGVHVILDVDGRITAHAAVVERELHVGGEPLTSGYVEAVATEPADQGNGFGSMVMAEVADIIAEGYELGALSTGSPGFYERLGWRRWAGPTYVRTAAGEVRTADDDDGILVLVVPASPPIDPGATISCEDRAGDVW
jgi:aminoglycoside 2'-N-acetyltransferase I